MSSTLSSDLSFQFVFSEGLALRGARIEDNVPVLLFTPCPKMPTIKEEDLAAVLRTVYLDDTYPRFFFETIVTPFHPFLGNWLKTYSPNWLRGTGLGELLFEADWIMKCLMAGVRSNKEMTKFTAWEETSNLEGFASKLDFFPDEKPTSFSVYMSCCPLKVYETDNELWFSEEPKIRIDDYSCKAYSDYITAIFDSIAYHDEPLLLKVREVPKLVLLARWLKGHRVPISTNWMMEKTKPIAVDNTQGKRKFPSVRKIKKALKKVGLNSNTRALVPQFDQVVDKDISNVEIVDDRLIKWKETTKVRPIFPGFEPTTVTCKVTASFDDFDRIYNGLLDPNIPINWSFAVGPYVNPFTKKELEPLSVGSWSELSCMVVSPPAVWQPAVLGFNYPCTGGGVNLGSATKVPTTVSPVKQNVMEGVLGGAIKHEQFRGYPGSNSVGVAATRKKVKSREAPKSVVPKVKQENEVPTPAVAVDTELHRRNKAIKVASKGKRVYGTCNIDTGEVDCYTSTGEQTFCRTMLHQRQELSSPSPSSLSGTFARACQTPVSFTSEESRNEPGQDLQLPLGLLCTENQLLRGATTDLSPTGSSDTGCGDSVSSENQLLSGAVTDLLSPTGSSDSGYGDSVSSDVGSIFTKD
ncbi:uncharacterized protein LOC134182043 [Corticium candelabrum]|uniref:uncharacterized protein LOC134182043 n=1 Tax=Corticium candelabrum TaxID=121492 RepID=UPI002E275A65|nr:uncharacterized protein LOC134182043 [Corticium candelabrum]